ncbi:Major Facilitator Superfamily [Nesidiocoris tenuis]|uniref:Major Facilitator Superfamily n=1 Tax=Nesidiocoris tenuis TaxID=355587 RepID=A0ABN7ASL6_9HEMI|nr:Major Facilitator Superfamily [Nesidiocoris tenuis]
MNSASTPPAKLGLGHRHVQALLMFFGCVAAFTLRVNLSVGIVAMTTKLNNESAPAVDWDSKQKGAISGAFFWGYMVTQVPAGLLAIHYGPKRVIGYAILFCGFATILFPYVALHFGYIAAYIFRILQGFGQGCVYPCINAHLSKWTVPEERGKLVSVVFSGGQIGTILMLQVGGVLAAHVSWETIFYSSGLVGVVWGCTFLLFGADSPNSHPTISAEECEYIESRLVDNNENTKNSKTPWRQIATSLPMWGLLAAHLAFNWGFWSMVTLVPSYMESALGYPIQANGFISSLPYVAMFFSALIFSAVSDYTVSRKIVSLTFTRKLWNSIALYGGAAGLIGVALSETNRGAALACLTVSTGALAGVYCGFLANHMDLSPNYAGVLMGITNGLANISSILGPYIAGCLTPEQDSIEQWQKVFYLSAIIFAVGNTIYLLFGTAVTQPWNELVMEKDVESNKGPSQSSAKSVTPVT